MTKDKTGMRLKFRYWFTYMAIGAGLPFITLYYKTVLSSPEGVPALEIIGSILLIQPLLSLLSNPIAGILADKFKIKDKILFFCALFTSAGILFIIAAGLPFFSPHSLLQKAGIISLGLIIVSLFQSPIVPLINAETLDHLHNTRSAAGNYGHYRVFGSLSWAFITTCTGLIIYLSSQIIFSPILYSAGFFILALVSLSSTRSKIQPIKIPWKKLAGDRPFLLFLIFVFLQSFGLQSSYNFTSYFMDDLNLNIFAIGIAFAISALPELPVMFRAEKILRLMGQRKMIIAGTGLLTLKTILLVLFSFLNLGYLIILPMLLHGIGYSLQINGMINFMARRADKDLRAIYMSLFGMFGMSLAMASGNFTSALLIKYFTSTGMMIINSGIAIIAILFFTFFVREKADKKPVITGIQE